MSTEFDPVEIYASRLTSEYQYPREDIRREVSHAFGKARYIVDLLVMKQGKPYIIAEVKARSSSDIAVDQLLGYARAMDSEFAVASNGYTDSCYKISRVIHDTRLEPIPDIPAYGRTLEDLGTHKNSELVRMKPRQFRAVILHTIDLISSNQGLTREEAAKEAFKLLLLKIFDESLENGLFRARYKEPSENVQSRIVALAMQANETYRSILCEPPNLSNELLVACVHSLQKYSLLDSGRDIIGSKLPVGDILGPHTYEFSTPRDLVRLMIDLLNPTKGSTFIDPACGVGGLVTEAASRGCTVTGIEINASIAQYANVNLAVSGLHGEIFAGDSLASNQGSTALTNLQENAYDYAALVPPLGGKVADERLNNFSLGTTRRSQRVEALFLERTLRFLRPGGRMIIAVPENFLLVDSALDAREFALKESGVKAIVSLPKGVLLPLSSMKISLLLLERSPGRGTTQDDPVFVAIMDNMAELPHVVSCFRAFERGEAIRDPIVFVTNIVSARQMNPSYLWGVASEIVKPRVGGVADVLYRMVELHEIATLTAGIGVERIGKNDPQGEFSYVRAGNIGDFVLDLRKNVKVLTNRDVRKWVAKPGDILMTRVGTVGKVALVQDDSPPIIVGSNVLKMSVLDKRRVLPEFLLAYLASTQGMAQIDMYTAGSTIRAISTSSLAQIKIPLLPMEQQVKVAQQVRRVIAARREASRVLEEMRAREDKLLVELDDLLLED